MRQKALSCGKGKIREVSKVLKGERSRLLLKGQAQYLDLNAAAPLVEAEMRRLSTWLLSPPSHPRFYVSPAPASSSFGLLLIFFLC